MTELYINNELAYLPEDFSITFIAENPYFTKSSSYTLDINLPMPANYKIFGNINRLDVSKKKIILPARLIANARTLLIGSAVLLSVEDTSVRVQLVSGNAEFNMLTNDDVYIDELDLGTASWPNNNQNQFQKPDNMKLYYGSSDEIEVVWLPVFFQEAKWENLQNDAIYEFGTNNFTLCPYWGRRCVQPYLKTAIRKIVEHFGYHLNDDFFKDNYLRHLYIASAVATNEIAKALPHWSLSEFFDELERFLAVVTVVDEITKEVRFVPLNDYFKLSDKIEIPADNIVREFTVEIDDDVDEKDLTTGNVGYDLPSHTDDGFLKLNSDVLNAAYKEKYATYNAMVEAYNNKSLTDKQNTLFIVADKRYYINYKGEGDNDNKLMEVNLYADLIRNPESEDIDTTLRIVPAKILQFNVGVFGSVAEYDLNRPYTSMVLNIPAVNYQVTIAKTEKFNIQQAIEGQIELAEKQGKNEYMELAFNTGEFNRQNVTYQGQVHDYNYAYPFTDYMQKTGAQLTDFQELSLSLNDVCEKSIGHTLAGLSMFHSNVSYTIQFLADKMPDVNKVFLIGNKRYLCEKIEADVTGVGLSKLMKGTFFRIE